MYEFWVMPMNDKRADESIQKNFLEWVVFGSSILLILLVLGYLTYQAFSFKPSSPDLHVAYRHDPSQQTPFRYQLTITNTGGETAEEVKLEASLEKGGQSIEKVELTIDFSPKASKREGWVIFKTDPAQADSLVARVVSFKKP